MVNVSSIAATIPMRNLTAYGVAKAAQDALTRSLALEFAAKGVRINAVAPGQASFSSIRIGIGSCLVLPNTGFS